eukprot:468648_1
MDNMSKLLQIFFYTKSTKYKLPILNSDKDFHLIYKNLEKQYIANQPFYFSTIIKLFPNVQQLALDGCNFDWSLKRFTDFLSIYDFEFHKIQLQDIYLRHISDKQAKQNLINNNARDNLYKLKKLGWNFVNSTYLHRVNFEPLPELPFLMTFIDYHNNNNQQNLSVRIPHLFRTHSRKIMLEESTSPNINTGEVDGKAPIFAYSCSEESKTENKYDYDEEGSNECILIDHNPKNCYLAKKIFDTLDYKKKLIELLKWRKLNHDTDENNDVNGLKGKFVNECKNVESLVLNKVSIDLMDIFYDNNSNNYSKSTISFNSTVKIFPSVTDLFLRETTFKLRECYKFINFINQENKNNNKKELKLERIFYSIKNKIRERDINKVKLRLKEIGWNWIHSQQMIGKI